MPRFVLIGGAVALLLAGIAPRLAAQELISMQPPEGINNLIGSVIGSVPDYEGSDDYTFAAGPLFQHKFSPTNRYILLTGNAVHFNIIHHENWRFGPTVTYRGGRKKVEDQVVKLMADLDNSVELGAFLGYQKQLSDDIRHKIGVQLDIASDVTGGHDGTVAQISGTYWRPLAKSFVVGFRGHMTYADDDYMSSYFGVNASDSTASGLQSFTAGRGLKDAGMALMGAFHLSASWHIAGGIQYKALLNDAADSPVVDVRGSSSQLYSGLSLINAW